MRKILLLVCAITFCCCFLNAQTKAISGNVVDVDTNEAIVGAHIISYPSGKIGVTDFDGNYSIRKVPETDNLLKVTMVGYLATQRAISSSLSAVDFELRESVDELSEVVVTGTRTLKTLSSTPILTKLITSQQIEATGATSALDALEYALPGITFGRNPHNTSMTIQGLGNRYILVLLDGQRMTGETLDQVNMSRINADDIEKIEVLSGAASALYGSNAIGSVVNIITKKNTKKWQGNAGIRFSPKNTDLQNDIALGYKNRGMNLRFSGFFRNSGGYDLDDSDNYATQPSFVDYSGKLSMSYDLTENIRINAKGRYFASDTESGNSNVPAHKLRENFTYGAGVEFRPTSKHVMQLKANADDSKQTYTHLGKNPDEVFAENQFKTLSLLDTYTYNDDLQFVLGAEYNYESVFSLSTFGDAPTNKDVTDFNAYLQTDYEITPSLNLVAGLRYTHHETFGSHYTPKFTLMHTLGNFKFRGNLSWGYKTPSLKHLYYNFFMGGMFWIYGNSELKPETSLYHSLSVEYAKKNVNVSVNVFKNKLEDKIDGYFAVSKETGKRSYYYKNYSAVRIRGVETFMKIRFSDNLSSQIGYNFLDTRDLETDRQIPGTSKHMGVGGFTWSDAKMKNPIAINLSGRVHSERIYYAEKKGATSGNVLLVEENESGYWIWKASCSQNFEIFKKYNLKVRFGVDNIFDYQKENDEIQLNPGRTFWGALKIYL